MVSQVTLESVEIIEIQTFVIGLPVGPAVLPKGTQLQCGVTNDECSSGTGRE